jgi:hypothetical protein
MDRMRFSLPGIEPTINEMLTDPVCQLVLRCDGLEPEDILQVVAEARSRLGLAARARASA